jgi:hypothetical protein
MENLFTFQDPSPLSPGSLSLGVCTDVGLARKWLAEDLPEYCVYRTAVRTSIFMQRPSRPTIAQPMSSTGMNCCISR